MRSVKFLVLAAFLCSSAGANVAQKHVLTPVENEMALILNQTENEGFSRCENHFQCPERSYCVNCYCN